jgi:cytochrome c oxidase subunit 3
MEKKTLHKAEPKTYEITVQKKYRNYKWLLYFALAGMSFMFLSLTFLYFLSHLNAHQPAIKIPLLFYWNTVVLLGSSFSVYLAQHHYKEDNFSEYKSSLILVLGLGILFLVGQVSGWMLLFSSGYNLSHQSAAYLYVISGIHALHIIGGLIYLSYFISGSRKMLNVYATSVVYFTDPVAKSQLKLFAIFWHFLGVIWIYLLSFFLIVG